MRGHGHRGAVEMLATVLAGISDPADEGVGADDFEQTENGVAATIFKPGGDRYRVTVEWLGDREADA